MNYFLDSNVIVSHIFSWDSLNIIANDFISSENYFSGNVIKEVENVFNEKCQEYDYFLLMLCRLFENFSDNNFILFVLSIRYSSGKIQYVNSVAITILLFSKFA